MTFGKLKDAVARLGFESEIEDDGALIPALHRALHTVYTDRPVMAEARLVKPKFAGRLVFSHLEHKAGGVEKYSLDGRAVSMTLSGCGSYAVISSRGTERRSFDSPSMPVRIILGKDAEIEFSGDKAFSVLHLTVFESVRSDNASELPLWSERGEIDLGLLIPDLLSVSEMPRDEHGNVIQGAVIRADVLTLPDDYSGEVVIGYMRAPTLPSGVSDEEIDVPRECAELLPLLVASYVWLEDSPDVAEYYYSLYRDGINTLARRMPRVRATKYETNGWA